MHSGLEKFGRTCSREQASSAVDGAKAAWLRARYAREVSRIGLSRQSVVSASWDLLSYVLQGMAAAALCHAAIGYHPAGWALYLPVLFFIGTRFRAIGNMLHEASHGMLVQGKRENRFLGHLLAILDFTVLEHYTEEHFSHHRHLGLPGKDLDFLGREKFGFARRDGGFVWKHLVRPLALLHVPTFLRPVLWSKADPWRVSACRLLFLLGLVGLALAIGGEPFLLYYVLPYTTAYQVIRYWSDAVDHAQIIAEPDEFERSRNHAFSWAPLNWIVFPRADAYHLVHHLFPAVPTPHQQRVHELLLKEPLYAARDHSVAQFFSRSGGVPDEPLGVVAANE
jgi:fatty acid desaturase